MAPDGQAPKDPGAAEKATYANLCYHERQAFLWTCLWSVGMILSFGGSLGTGYWVRLREKELAAIEAKTELFALQRWGYVPTAVLGMILSVCLLAFLISLGAWLLAMRRRRQAEVARFP